MSAVSHCPVENTSELSRFWREMRPTPGRTASSLRFALMSALAVLFMLVLQTPVVFIAPALFFLSLVSHDTPRRCVRELLLCLCAGTLGTVAAIALLAATGADPVSRVVGVAGFTFLAAFFVRTSLAPGLPMSFGCLTYMVISLWEYRMPPERTLHLSLWAMSAATTAACAAAIVEYLFNRNDALTMLRNELATRCAALRRLFELSAAGGDAAAWEEQSDRVRRFASGDAQLHTLLDSVAAADCGGVAELARLRAVVLALDRLLVLGVALPARGAEDDVEAARLRAIAAALSAVAEFRLEQIGGVLGAPAAARLETLDLIESTLRRLGETGSGPAQHAEPEAAPDISWRGRLRSLLLPDAFTNDAHFIYALKLSLCATICYVIYNGLKWPGISTAFWTVYFTGLSTTGTTNRKLLFRVIGSTLGGALLGLGCLAFVFPNIEGVTGLLLVVAAVSFVGFWIMGSSYFGYIGMQTMFSFNLLAFETARIPNQLTPARDRLLGIGIAFLVMFLIFHQVRPERTVDTMRRLLARLLRAQAEMLHLLRSNANAVSREQLAGIRCQIAAFVTNLHGFATGVQFEFPPDRAADLRLSDTILSAAALSEELLLWMQRWVLAPDSERETGGLSASRAEIEGGLRILVDALEKLPDAWPDVLRRATPASAVAPPYMSRALDSFRQLQMACDDILHQSIVPLTGGFQCTVHPISAQHFQDSKGT